MILGIRFWLSCDVVSIRSRPKAKSSSIENSPCEMLPLSEMPYLSMNSLWISAAMDAIASRLLRSKNASPVFSKHIRIWSENTFLWALSFGIPPYGGLPASNVARCTHSIMFVTVSNAAWMSSSRSFGLSGFWLKKHLHPRMFRYAT